jgi:uncharacterized DUF497 family protein
VQIETIVCSERIEAKLESKHHVSFSEARQILFSEPRIRFAENGHTLARMFTSPSGRRLAADIFRSFSSNKPRLKTAIVISARDMSGKERKAYGRK